MNNKKIFYKLFLFSIILAVFVNITYYLWGKYKEDQDIKLSYIGILGAITFIPFLRVKPYEIKNCVWVVNLLGMLVFLPFLIIKFDIIDLFIILIYLNFLNYIICNKGRRNFETRN